MDSGDEKQVGRIDLQRLKRVANEKGMPGAAQFVDETYDQVNNMFASRYQEQMAVIERLQNELKQAQATMWTKIRTDYESGMIPEAIISSFGSNSTAITKEEILQKASDERWEASGNSSNIRGIQDWLKAKSLYINGVKPSVIAKQLGIDLQKLYNKASREGWKKERNSYMRDLESKIFSETFFQALDWLSPPIRYENGEVSKQLTLFDRFLGKNAKQPFEDVPRGTNIQVNNRSGFRGVSELSNGKYRAYIWVENIENYSKGKKQQYLGTYTTPERAAIAYDSAAINLYNDLKMLNFPGLFEEY